MMMDFRENSSKREEYVQALEQERVKIQVFQRELPLCFQLVTQAIEAYKQQLSRDGAIHGDDQCINGHSECSEQTTGSDHNNNNNNGLILEQFIPLNDHDDDDDEEHESNKKDNDDDDDKSEEKSDWLRSVQLWNQSPDPPTIQQENEPKRISIVEVKKNGGGAFQPFQKDKNICTTDNNVNVTNKPTSATAASSCSSAEAATPRSGGNGGGKKEEKGGNSRKARRCWSPELHKRFLNALQQLGGSHTATPKQIREMMKVDGLTNDEVKSHLQKYRLHTRSRPNTTNQNTTNQQAPQFVVVGGIWMPPPEYASMATATTVSMDTSRMCAPNGVYAPIAAIATPSGHSQQKQSNRSHCEERGNPSDGGVHSNSPSTSSSTHTTN